MQHYQYRWVPIPLVKDLQANGERWELQSLSTSPGYWKYEGRLVKHVTYDGTITAYTSERGTHSSMRRAAFALLAFAIRRNARIDRELGR